MSIGYFDDLADANLYFTDERLETSAWDELIDTYRTKALVQAYNRLYYHPDFDIPAVADATAAQLIILKKANAEMAYYMALHLADEDRRKGIISQGVTSAGIVKEVYDKGLAGKVPIPPIVDALLIDFTELKAFGMADLDRDEDESVHTKVDEF